MYHGDRPALFNYPALFITSSRRCWGCCPIFRHDHAILVLAFLSAVRACHRVVLFRIGRLFGRPLVWHCCLAAVAFFTCDSHSV